MSSNTTVFQESICIEGKDIVKSFGKTIALKGVSFKIPCKTISCIIGPIGAGKTTLLRILAGLLKPDSGSITFRKDIKIISYLPEEVEPYDKLTGYENLTLFLGLRGLNVDEYVENLLRKLNVIEFVEKSVQTYSRGMKRLIMLASVLAPKCDLYILDEPFKELDVFSRTRLKEVLKEKLSECKSIIISTHELLEAQLICDYVIILHRGEKAFEGSTTEALELTKTSSLEDAFVKLVENKMVKTR